MGEHAVQLADWDPFLVYHGRLSHRETLEKIAQSDFSILLRPDRRYANAGFPTKLVESLASGVPVITNRTSDIGEYVRDGKEGFLLADSSVEACVEGLRRALRLDPSERARMADSARRRARECFDYRNYGDSLCCFIDEAVRGLAGA